MIRKLGLALVFLSASVSADYYALRVALSNQYNFYNNVEQPHGYVLKPYLKIEKVSVSDATGLVTGVAGSGFVCPYGERSSFDAWASTWGTVAWMHEGLPWYSAEEGAKYAALNWDNVTPAANWWPDYSPGPVDSDGDGLSADLEALWGLDDDVYDYMASINYDGQTVENNGPRTTYYELVLINPDTGEELSVIDRWDLAGADAWGESVGAYALSDYGTIPEGLSVLLRGWHPDVGIVVSSDEYGSTAYDPEHSAIAFQEILTPSNTASEVGFQFGQDGVYGGGSGSGSGAVGGTPVVDTTLIDNQQWIDYITPANDALSSASDGSSVSVASGVAGGLKLGRGAIADGVRDGVSGVEDGLGTIAGAIDGLPGGIASALGGDGSEYDEGGASDGWTGDTLADADLQAVSDDAAAIVTGSQSIVDTVTGGLWDLVAAWPVPTVGTRDSISFEMPTLAGMSFGTVGVDVGPYSGMIDTMRLVSLLFLYGGAVWTAFKLVTWGIH